MPLVLNDLKAKLTRRLGSPSVSDLPDEVKTDALESARKEFSRYRPYLDNEYVSVEAGVTDYELSNDVQDVSEGYALPSSLSYDVLLTIDAVATEALLAAGGVSLADMGWSWSVIPGSPSIFRLEIEPIAAAELLLTTESLREWEDLSEKDENAILTWAQAEALEYIGRKRNKSISKIPTAVGQLTLNTGYNDRADGFRMREEFRRMMGQGATVLG